MRYRTDLHCTRCAHSVSDRDLEARFKHGEIIACSSCEPVVIFTPTEAEMKMSLRMPFTANGLDSEIERKELQNLFFVSMTDFIDSTYDRLGCERTPENRRKIRTAFLNATETIVYAVVDAELLSRRKNS